MPGPRHDQPLPPAAAEALAGGRAVEAVKIVRDTLGLGLRDAHALVARHAHGAGSARADASGGGGQASPPDGELVVPRAVVEAMERGELLEAIRELREANRHLDLRGARRALEQHRLASGGGASASASPRARAPRVPRVPRVPTVREGDRDGRGWLVGVALLLLSLAWWLFGPA